LDGLLDKKDIVDDIKMLEKTSLIIGDDLVEERFNAVS